jgi:hypothetical protein
MPLAEPPPKNAGRFGKPLGRPVRSLCERTRRGQLRRAVGRDVRRRPLSKPELLAVVEYLTWTDSNTLCVVTYQGLREDKRCERW